jgi:hypothetical protein
MHSSSDTTALHEVDRANSLWNPSAAACWSLLFTPAFGAFLLMRNWEALGDARQAAAARKWFVFGIGLLLVRLLSAAINSRLNTESNLIPWLSWGFLLAWWLAQAAPQAKLVHSRLGVDYRRQSWDYAVLLGLVCGIAYMVSAAVFSWLFTALT